ncbi:MAG: hypothetical protein IJ154_03990 [Bacteroidales bacterium]|nr:hypothetical protein [Bacteroidales bacterium]
MKSLKTLLVAALAIVSMSVVAQNRQQGQGQRGQGRGMATVAQRAERETARINEAVKLTDAQVAEINKINYKYAAQDSVRFAQMRAQGNNGQQMDREAMMKQRQEIQNAKTAELNKVLTADQQKKYQKMLEDQAAQMRNMGQRGQGGQRGQRN